MLFNPTRDQVRQFFLEAWYKRRQGQPLAPLETMAADLIGMHPEYHALLDDGDKAREREWSAADGELNPFLHLALHLALEEQLQIDQPPGIRALLAGLDKRRGDRHAALHEAIECLGETVWQAQQNGGAPDAAAYLDCVRRKT